VEKGWDRTPVPDLTKAVEARLRVFFYCLRMGGASGKGKWYEVRRGPEKKNSMNFEQKARVLNQSSSA